MTVEYRIHVEYYWIINKSFKKIIAGNVVGNVFHLSYIALQVAAVSNGPLKKANADIVWRILLVRLDMNKFDSTYAYYAMSSCSTTDPQQML